MKHREQLEGCHPEGGRPSVLALSSSETGMSSEWLLVPSRDDKVSSSLNEELSSMLCERFAPAGYSLEGFIGLDTGSSRFTGVCKDEGLSWTVHVPPEKARKNKKEKNKMAVKVL